MSIVCFALVGALLAYLLFNSAPASVFMGDTGSLSLGGFAACIGCFSGNMLYIAVIGILVIDVSIVELCALLSVFLIEGYSGNKGKFPKWLGYIFYPAHLMILYLLSIFV